MKQMNYLLAPMYAKRQTDIIEIMITSAIESAKELHSDYIQLKAGGWNHYNHDFGFDEMKGSERYTPYVEARRVFFFLLKKFTNESCVSGAKILGKDHATFLHHNKTIENLCFSSPSYSAFIDSVIDRTAKMLIVHSSQSRT
jgi:chromosomal replication initiation ATPase DnaA